MSERLLSGQVAPDFEAEASDGTRVCLADYRSQRVWLSLHRYAGCPLCNLRVHQMVEKFAVFEARGIAVLAVFQSTRASVLQSLGGQRAPFALLCDPLEKIYKLYGAEARLTAFLSPKNLLPAAEATRRGFLPGPVEGTMARIPAEFLIEPDGRIARAFYGEVISDHLSMADVVAW